MRNTWKVWIANQTKISSLKLFQDSNFQVKNEFRGAQPSKRPGNDTRPLYGPWYVSFDPKELES